MKTSPGWIVSARIAAQDAVHRVGDRAEVHRQRQPLGQHPPAARRTAAVEKSMLSFSTPECEVRTMVSAISSAMEPSAFRISSKWIGSSEHAR